MLQPVDMNWTRGGDVRFVTFYNPFLVASLQHINVEDQHPVSGQPVVVAPTGNSEVIRSPTPSQIPNNMDTAMYALGMTGVWMIIIGCALLARRLAKTERRISRFDQRCDIIE